MRLWMGAWINDPHNDKKADDLTKGLYCTFKSITYEMTKYNTQEWFRGDARRRLARLESNERPNYSSDERDKDLKKDIRMLHFWTKGVWGEPGIDVEKILGSLKGKFEEGEYALPVEYPFCEVCNEKDRGHLAEARRQTLKFAAKIAYAYFLSLAAIETLGYLISGKIPPKTRNGILFKRRVLSGGDYMPTVEVGAHRVLLKEDVCEAHLPFFDPDSFDRCTCGQPSGALRRALVKCPLLGEEVPAVDLTTALFDAIERNRIESNDNEFYKTTIARLQRKL